MICESWEAVVFAFSLGVLLASIVGMVASLLRGAE